MPGGHESAVAGAEDALLAVDPLLDLAGDHVDHLLLVGVVVEVVALARPEADVDDGELLRAGRGRVAEPACLPQSSVSGVASAAMVNLPFMRGLPSAFRALAFRADRLEGAGLVGERLLDRQALHRGRAVEAVAGARRASRM